MLFVRFRTRRPIRKRSYRIGLLYPLKRIAKQFFYSFPVDFINETDFELIEERAEVIQAFFIYAQQKQRVFRKIAAFVEKFKGVGGTI